MTLGSARTTVAYFSMEICLEQAIPTYSGGLGVLAGDTLRSAADLGVPLVAVTLLDGKHFPHGSIDPTPSGVVVNHHDLGLRTDIEKREGGEAVFLKVTLNLSIKLVKLTG